MVAVVVMELTSSAFMPFVMFSLASQNAQQRSHVVRRADPLPRYVRQLARGEVMTAPPVSQPQQAHAQPQSDAVLRQRLEHVATLLSQTRVHGELLARYNPVYGKSEQERIKATANRVGLDVPKEYEDAVRNAQRLGPGIDDKYR